MDLRRVDVGVGFLIAIPLLLLGAGGLAALVSPASPKGQATILLSALGAGVLCALLGVACLVQAPRQAGRRRR